MSTSPQVLLRETPVMPEPMPAPNDPAASRKLPTPEVRAAWPRYIGVWAAVLTLLLGVLHKDVVHLATRWWNSETYGHCLLIIPIVVWLLWQRKEGLARLAPRPWAIGALFMLGAGIVWLIGDLAGVALLRHTGIVLLVIASVPTIFGLAVARGMMFPLFFLLFLIPVGEQLEPWLQTITAEFATWALRLTGVPTHMDGVFISIPNGDFEVAEACSGVRFLIAMVAFGALVANVCFKSWKRRIIFMAFAFSLPIFANGVRVWGTIYAAHLTTPEVARGIDHVVYGWVFFAVVMVLLLALSWRHFDRPVDDPFIDPEDIQKAGTLPAPMAKLLPVALLAFIAGAAAPAWSATVAAEAPDQPTAALQLAPPPGWREVSYSGGAWKPIYRNPDAESFRHFVDDAGQPVDLYIAVYDRQYEGHEVVSFGQGVIELLDEGGWSWAANEPAPPGAKGMQIKFGPYVRDVVQYHWVNGKLTGSPYSAKVETLKARLFGGEPRAGTLIVSAQRVDTIVSARPAIDRFLAGIGPADQAITKAIVTGPAAE